MNKWVLLIIYFALIEAICAYNNKNIVSSFLSYINSKINYKNEVSKVIEMDNTVACLMNNNSQGYNECLCDFKKINEFEKKCSYHLKKSQEEAKNCSEEHCEICCNLVKPKNQNDSILAYELVCKKKCTKSNITSPLNQDDYKLAFTKLFEFIRIFYPSNILSYHPIQNKKYPIYTNKVLNTKYQQIADDLNLEANQINREYVNNGITPGGEDKSEDLFSPYDEN
ncbi:secreted ookinete protein, putative [Plasmodium vinckei brucechwatti]|uniref:Secreted ookinete protein, putative n=1 Tax=Plasmodium vinckei brucechwatti TaxID=119398 RepID=A0A6V7SXS6_PLAVN|nr:secreted ookinete protein, putative [Plasmodium vinckei brucechwatti]